MHKKGSGLYLLAKALVKIGALNWGLIGVGYFFGKNWNLVELLLGSMPTVENIVYILVGLSAFVVCMYHCMCKKGKKGKDECCGGGSCSTKK